MIPLTTLIVPTLHDGNRLDRFVRESLPAIPGRSVKAALEEGNVSIAGRRCSKGDTVRAGDRVIVSRLAEEADWFPIPGDVAGASVVYCDASVAVLNKPEGVHTEPVAIREEGTMAGYYSWRFPDAIAWGSLQDSPLLSRLDRDTSGVILAALTEPAFRSLLAQRQAGAIAKRYLCRVDGKFEEAAAIRWVIESKGGDRVRVKVGVDDPDPAYWTRIHPVSSDGMSSIVSAAISKGRRHQIRAHLAAAGHPIAGDRIYGKAGGGRLMLHAAEVEFTHPDTGATMRVASPIPEEFGV